MVLKSNTGYLSMEIYRGFELLLMEVEGVKTDTFRETAGFKEFQKGGNVW